MILKFNPWTKDKTFGLVRDTALVALAAIPIGVFVLFFSHGYGGSETATGIVNHRTTKGSGSKNWCDLYIIFGKTDLLHTITRREYCDPDFAPGKAVVFDYKRNVFGKMVLDEFSTVRPASQPDPP